MFFWSPNIFEGHSRQWPSRSFPALSWAQAWGHWLRSSGASGLSSGRGARGDPRAEGGRRSTGGLDHLVVVVKTVLVDIPFSVGIGDFAAQVMLV